MALTKRVKKERPVVERQVDTPRVNPEDTKQPQTTDSSVKKEWAAKDRKTIKVDPDIKSLIDIFSDFDGSKSYDTVRQMAEYYLEHNYDERAQRIIMNIQNNKFIN